MNYTTLRTVNALFTKLMLAMVATLAITTAVSAQTPQYKVGDRVEYDHLQMRDPANAVWYKGTIVKVGEAFYEIEVDTKPGQLPQIEKMPIRGQEKWMKPLAGAAPAAKTLPEGVPADPEGILDCPVKQGRVTHAPQAELLKKLIRCRNEKKGADRTEESLKIDITGFQIGAGRPWRPLRDYGNGGPGTTVYPIKVESRWIRYYTRSIQVQDNVAVWGCFVNKNSEWECGVLERISDGRLMNYPRP